MNDQTAKAKKLDMIANALCVTAGVAGVALFLYLKNAYPKGLIYFFESEWGGYLFALSPLLLLLMQPKAQKSWTPEAEQRYAKYKILLAVSRTMIAWSMVMGLGGIAIILVVTNLQEEPSWASAALPMLYTSLVIGGVLSLCGLGVNFWSRVAGKGVVDFRKY